MNKIQKLSRNTENAPSNTFSSQTVAFSHYNNFSAQLPIDPKSGKLVGTDIKEQATQCLENIKAIVESIDHTMEDVVKMTIFLTDISDIDAVNSVYKTFFKKELPTRTVVAVASLAIHGALVQIDTLISNGEGTTPQKPLELIKVTRNTENAPKDSLASQTVAFSHYNNISGQLPIDLKTQQLVSGGIKEQTAQCLTNVKAILESIGHVLNDVVKTTIYLKRSSDIETVNDVFAKWFPNYVPARTVVIASDLPMNSLIQIDCAVSHGDGTPPQLAEDARFLVIEANNTENAPKTSYTQTVTYSHYNHISGQLPLNTKTNKIVGDVKEQAAQCLENIKAIVESIDHTIDDVVKINIQLKNIADIDAINDVYKSFFSGELPARTVIGVTEIPMNALVQMDAVVSNAEGTPA
ncbi:MAG: RidA family protein [Flavobacterium sp.]